MFVDCPYQEKCADYHSELCKTCKKNNNRSYYEPVQETCYPYVWPYQWTYHWPYQWPITSNPCCGDATTTDTTYYEDKNTSDNLIRYDPNS